MPSQQLSLDSCPHSFSPSMASCRALVPYVRRPRFVPEAGDGFFEESSTISVSGDGVCGGGSSWDVDGKQ